MTTSNEGGSGGIPGMMPNMPNMPALPGAPDPAGLLNKVTSMTQQRVKLNIKVLGVQLGKDQEGAGGGGVGGERGDKASFKEVFTAPEMSIVSKLFAKVSFFGV